MCSEPLFEKVQGRIECQASCGFVNYDNPTPVAAMVVEYEGKILLAHNRAWKGDFYGLITGFVDHREHPRDCAVREVKEETDLDVDEISLLGVYAFERMNQIIVGYHVVASGQITLNEELDKYVLTEPEECKYWETGTGYALRDCLQLKGLEPELLKIR
jgi:NADH pyrophosphatase NudC (nudix superfamily)